MSRTCKTRTALLIGVLSLFIDLGWYSLDRDFLTQDAKTYLAAADNMRSGNGFSNERLEPETRRTPGYPALLAVSQDLGLTLDTVILLQHVMRALLAAALFLLTERLLHSPFMAIAAGVVFALDFPSIVLANKVMSETMFTVVNFAVFSMILTWPRHGRGSAAWSIALGLLAGFSVLIRPIAILLFVPIGVYGLLVFKKNAARLLLLMTAGFAVFPVGWAWHNYDTVGVPTVSPLASDNLLWYRAAGVLALEAPGPFNQNYAKAKETLSRQARTEGMRIHGPSFDSLPHARRAPVYTRLALDILKDHPGATLRLAARAIATILLGASTTVLAKQAGIPPAHARLIALAYTIPCLMFALAGMVYLFRRSRATFWAILLFVGYFVILPAGAEGNSRFRVPVMPMYAMAIAAGLYFLWNRFRKTSAT